MNDGVAGLIAVLALLGGATLFTMGALSLLVRPNPDDQARKQGARAARKTGDRTAKNLAALAFGLALVVGAEAVFMTSGLGGRYLSGQKIDVTECEYQIEEAHPQERRNNPQLVRKEIVGCMDRLGYEWTQEHDHCREAPLATNVFCYLPKDKFSRVVVAFQARFE